MNFSGTDVLFLCMKCNIHYREYGTLVEHLHWVHGTISTECPVCSFRMWDFALHECFFIPSSEYILSDQSDESDDDSDASGSIGSSASTSASVSSNSSSGVSSLEPSRKKTAKEEKPPSAARLIQYSPSMRTRKRKFLKPLPAFERDSQYCSCGQNIEGSNMVGCDGEGCFYEWFHYTCVGITVAPEGDWLCPYCR